MKLKNILKYIDESTDVIIWQDVGMTEEKWEVVYEGDVYNVSWKLTECKLIEAEDNEDSEAICPFIKDGNVKLRITLQKD